MCCCRDTLYLLNPDLSLDTALDLPTSSTNIDTCTTTDRSDNPVMTSFILHFVEFYPIHKAWAGLVVDVHECKFFSLFFAYFNIVIYAVLKAIILAITSRGCRLDFQRTCKYVALYNNSFVLDRGANFIDCIFPSMEKFCICNISFNHTIST